MELNATGDRVVKHTEGGKFGHVLEGVSAPFGHYADLREATPQEYLHRLDASNKLFGDDARVEGVSKAGGSPVGIVTSQRYIVGTSPTPAQIDTFMIKNGFQKVDAKAFANDYIADKTWFHARSGYMVADTKPDNFKLTPAGKLVPIDVIVQHAPAGSALHSALSAQIKKGA